MKTLLLMLMLIPVIASAQPNKQSKPFDIFAPMGNSYLKLDKIQRQRVTQLILIESAISLIAIHAINKKNENLITGCAVSAIAVSVSYSFLIFHEKKVKRFRSYRKNH